MEEKKEKKPGLLFSYRLLFALMSNIGILLLYMLRNNTNFAVICMIKTHSGGQDCNGQPKNHTANDGFLEWNQSERFWATNSFFIGYACLQIPAIILAQYIGPRIIFMVTVLGSSAINFISPAAAYGGLGYFITARILLGLAQSASFPILQAMVATWSPPEERSRMSSIIYSGMHIGIMLTNITCATICKKLSWEWIYYIFGSAGVVWSVLWMLLIADSPAKQWCMPRKEREYIVDSLVGTAKAKTFRDMPWKDMLLSPPVWAILVAHFCMNYGNYFVQASLPTFIKEVLKSDMMETGVTASVPFVVSFIMMNVFGFLSDWIRKRGWLSNANNRRLFMAIASIGLSVFLVASGFVGCGQMTLATVLFSAGVGLANAQYSAHIVSYIEIAPAYAGVITSLANTASSVAGLFCGLIPGWMTPDNSAEEWRSVFYVAVGITLFGATFYCIFVRGEVQSWAITEESKEGTSTDPSVQSVSAATTLSSDDLSIPCDA